MNYISKAYELSICLNQSIRTKAYATTLTEPFATSGDSVAARGREVIESSSSSSRAAPQEEEEEEEDEEVDIQVHFFF